MNLSADVNHYFLSDSISSVRLTQSEVYELLLTIFVRYMDLTFSASAYGVCETAANCLCHPFICQSFQHSPSYFIDSPFDFDFE